MPLINNRRNNRDKRYSKHKNDNLNHRAVYNTNTWRKLRLLYLQEHPLCERCEQEGKITSAIHVHHKVEIDRGQDMMQKKTIGYNWQNLEALCEDCHQQHHYNKRRNIDMR